MRTPVLDLAPLTEPVTADEVQEHRRAAVARGEAPGAATLLVRLGLPAVTAAAAVVGVAVVAHGGRPAWTVVVGVVVAVVAVVAATRSAASSRRSWRTWAVLDRFAARNGLRFVPEYAAPADPAEQLRRGKQRRRSEWFRFPGDRVQVANHRYSVTSGGGDARSTSVHRVGVVAVRLDRTLPRLVIDAVAHDRHRRATGSHAPRGALERVVLQRADFDRPYRLFLQAGAQREAMSALSARLVDELAAAAAAGAPWDVEAVGGTVFLLQPESLDLTDPATWRRVMSLVAAVVERVRTSRPPRARGPRRRSAHDRAAPTAAVDERRVILPTGIGMALALAAGAVADVAPLQRLDDPALVQVLEIAVGVLIAGETTVQAALLLGIRPVVRARTERVR